MQKDGIAKAERLWAECERIKRDLYRVKTMAEWARLTGELNRYHENMTKTGYRPDCAYWLLECRHYIGHRGCEGCRRQGRGIV